MRLIWVTLQIPTRVLESRFPEVKSPTSCIDSKKKSKKKKISPLCFTHQELLVIRVGAASESKWNRFKAAFVYSEWRATESPISPVRHRQQFWTWRDEKWEILGKKTKKHTVMAAWKSRGFFKLYLQQYIKHTMFPCLKKVTETKKGEIKGKAFPCGSLPARENPHGWAAPGEMHKTPPAPGGCWRSWNAPSPVGTGTGCPGACLKPLLTHCVHLNTSLQLQGAILPSCRVLLSKLQLPEACGRWGRSLQVAFE